MNTLHRTILAAAVSVPLFAMATGTAMAVNGEPAGQPVQDEFYKATIESVTERTAEASDEWVQNMTATIESGAEAGTEITLEYLGGQDASGFQKFETGDRVVVVKSYGYDTVQYFIADRYRLPALYVIATIFALIIIVFAGMRGFTALLGLGCSILVLTLYIVPQIVEGKNPLVVSCIGAFAIACVTLYLAHGFTKRTTIALVSTLISILIAIICAVVFVNAAQLAGLGSEEAYFIQFGLNGLVNVRGLLLGGIIIGTLGILDDITTAQTAAVHELAKADGTFSFAELYRRGFSVGKEHITSLVNTLALAYAGASLPLLLLFTMDRQPFWTTFNSQFIAEEIVRTLVGSIALIFAVPISTCIASYFYSRRRECIEGNNDSETF